MSCILLADSGATKCEWMLLNGDKKKKILTLGISPYFLNSNQISDLFDKELKPKLKKDIPESIFYYGTGLGNPNNRKILRKCLSSCFSETKVSVETDLMGAARALCGNEKGIACILGTGSNACFYNGNKITRNSPGLGYVLGDEGSGSYLGKEVVRHFLYDKFSKEMREKFTQRYQCSGVEILENVYTKPLANRYLAGFTLFLAENRGDEQIEKIIRNGLQDFLDTHITKFKEVKRNPVNFIGSVAFGFKDILKELCTERNLIPGQILKEPMGGLIKYHKQ